MSCEINLKNEKQNKNKKANITLLMFEYVLYNLLIKAFIRMYKMLQYIIFKLSKEI